MRRRRKVLLTVPHAGCFVVPSERHCDRNAETMAEAIEDVFQRRGIEVVIVKNHKMRTERDDANRVSGFQGTEFGQTVQKEIKSGAYDYLVDCHSYPFAINMPRDFYVLDFRPPQNINQSIVKFGGTTGLECAIFEASPANAIISFARQSGLTCTLLEVSEFLELGALRRVASAVVHAFAPSTRPDRFPVEFI